MKFDKKEIIGMIHLAGPDTVEKAMDEIKIYEEEGLSGIIVENYHGSIGSIMSVLDELKANPTTLSVGINILPNNYEEAFRIVNLYSIVDFIQLDYIAGKYVGGHQLDADDFINVSMSSRNVDIFGGVWPKYYKPVEESILGIDIFDAIFLGDAVVVTGSETGAETPIEKIKQYLQYIGDKPLIVGAGLTPENVKEQLSLAHGGIVGSAFKPNGRTNQMVDRDLVKKFMDEVKKI